MKKLKDGKFWGEDHKDYSDKLKKNIIYLWAKCPKCGKGRWVRKDGVKDNTSIKQCRECFQEEARERYELKKEDIAMEYFPKLPAEKQKKLVDWYVKNVLYAQKKE